MSRLPSPVNPTVVMPSFRAACSAISTLGERPEVLKKFYDLRRLGVDFYNYKDFYESLLRRVYLSQLSELWFLENINYREKRFYNLLKRFIDLIVGLVSAVDYFLKFWRKVDESIKLRRRRELLTLERQQNRRKRRARKHPSTVIAPGDSTWPSTR